MISRIGRAIKLKNHPVAVFRTAARPEGALQFKKGKWGCVISMLGAASKGRTAAFDADTTTCMGGKVGLGFKRFEPGSIEYFLSTGESGGRAGEYYKKSPALAREYVESLPDIQSKGYVVFQPLEELSDGDAPEIVVFLVNADQLSALVQFSGYDRSARDPVRIGFGSGCAQAVLFAMKEAESENPKCVVGLTDPSARRFVDRDLLSFSIPYRRYLELEGQVEESFLTKKTWLDLSKRI